jgi:hypothetical protein
MQNPTSKTRISKCLELATYAIRMFGKYPGNATLTTLAAELSTEKTKLSSAQQQYENAVDDILPARVDVKFENHRSDRRIRQTQQKVELADGKKNGPIAALVFPDGSTPITRLQGDSQIQAMADLEGRLESAINLWPDAANEKTELANHRQAYANALQARANVGQIVRDKRALRNAAKEAFLTKYNEITSRVAAEFPRDDATQDLFFDDVRSKSALDQSDDEGDSDSSDTANASSTGSP